MALALKNTESASATDQLIFSLDDAPMYPKFQAIFDLWNSKRGSRAMPTREDIDPRDMKKYLRYVQLYDVLGEGTEFIMRVLGSSFLQTIGYDPTGLLISEMIYSTMSARITQAALRVVQTCAPVRTTGTFTVATGTNIKRVESILLPLGSDNSVSQVLRQVDFAHEEPT